METLLLLLSLQWPIQGPVIQKPSMRHPAVDIACVPGVEVVAVHGGRLYVRHEFDMGNTVIINGTGLQSYYAHLQTVTEPREVVAGEVIGTCGSTGSLSNGPHLHFAVDSFGVYDLKENL